MTRRKIYEGLAWATISGLGLLLVQRTAGVLTFALATLTGLALFRALQSGIELVAAAFNKAPRLGFLRKLMLACLSIMLGLTLFEAFLAVVALTHQGETSGAETAGAGRGTLTMPEDFKRRDVRIEGAIRAYYWHNVLHVFNQDDMRLVGEFRPKRPDTFRVMVVGDSLTYGQGVPADATYSALLEAELDKAYRIEVLNLGRCGDQSEDVLRIVKEFLPKLKPDLVIYGVCLNDFLPSGKGEYENNLAWSISFPLQKHFADKTRLGGFLAKKYDDVLISLGLRADFVTDILRGFAGYQARFGRDVKEMNDVVVAAGLPPVTTLVLNHLLGTHKAAQRGYEIMAIAEKLLAEAGMQVVPSKGYVEAHRGKAFMVSEWEGHPDAAAHRIFANELRPYVERAPGLEKYRKGAAEAPSF
jgi:GDSL-like Lipase/Acylhydrolase family